MAIIVENEDKIIDVIYDRVCGYKLSEAVQILEKYRTKQLIPIEWIKKWCNEHNRKSLEERLLKRYGVITMLEDWEKENETN